MTIRKCKNPYVPPPCISIGWRCPGEVRILSAHSRACSFPSLGTSSRCAKCTWLQMKELVCTASLCSSQVSMDMNFIPPGLSWAVSRLTASSWGHYSQQDIWWIPSMSGQWRISGRLRGLCSSCIHIWPIWLSQQLMVHCSLTTEFRIRLDKVDSFLE